MILPASALALALAAAPPVVPPATAGLSLTGKTAADPKIVPDALQEVGGFATRALKCGEIEGVEASPLPRRWIPADPNFRIGPKGARYERWVVKLCGKSEPFLVALWKDKGRPQFAVGHPFPGGPPAPTKD